jgi:hypothetical protein
MALELVEKENLGISLPEDDTAAITAALQKWMEQKANGGVAFQAAASDKYHRRHLTAELAKVFASCL